MAMRRFSNTIILMTEKDPNMRRPKNRVNSFIPVNSKLSKSTSPKIAQNNVCEVSHKLIEKRKTKIRIIKERRWRIYSFYSRSIAKKGIG